MRFEKSDFGGQTCIPETPLEAVEQLEEFMLADLGQPDWDIKFLKSHFKICKDQLKRIEKELEK